LSPVEQADLGGHQTQSPIRWIVPIIVFN
jgi:hypothetical protein